MKVKDSKAAIEFLEEASRYFEKRPTHGEDKAYWSNVYNAEKCLGIVKLIEAKDSQIRTLEKGLLDLSVVVNDQVKEIKRLRAEVQHRKYFVEEARDERDKALAALEQIANDELPYVAQYGYNRIKDIARAALETKDD